MMPPVQQEVHPADSSKVVFSHASDYKTIYINQVQFAISFQDIGLVLGQITGADEKGIHVENQIRAMMSPQQAKLLAILLAGNIQAYEQRFGEIKLPAEATPPSPVLR